MLNDTSHITPARLREHADNIKQKIWSDYDIYNTWLGSWDHWLNDDLKSDLQFENGYPSLYYTFLRNMVSHKCDDMVIPLPLDSNNAKVVIKSKKIEPSVIHIDASHEYITAKADLVSWWEVLAPDGIMIMDDYNIGWDGVDKAVDEFCAERNDVKNFEAESDKCRFIKSK